MFSFLKNKVLDHPDLEKSILYLSYETKEPKENAENIGLLIWSEIKDSKKSGRTIQEIYDEYKDLKNDAVQKYGLSNVKHREFAIPYIVMSFFFAVGMLQEQSAQVAVSKILKFIKEEAGDKMHRKILEELETWGS